MIILFLLQYLSLTVVQAKVQGMKQSSKSALMENVTSERNIHCVIYFTDRSPSEVAITGLAVPAIIYHHTNNGYPPYVQGFSNKVGWLLFEIQDVAFNTFF